MAFIDGQEKKFDDVNAQNILAHNLDHRYKIITEIESERKSHNKDLQDNWNGDNFFQSLERIIPEIYLKHNLRKPFPTSSSTGPDKKNRLSKFEVPAHSIHLFDVNFTNDKEIFIYAVQGIDTEKMSETQDGDFHLDLLYEGIMQLASNMNQFDNKFDTSRTCAVCGRSGHTFDDCEALKNAKKIKQPYIKICVD